MATRRATLKARDTDEGSLTKLTGIARTHPVVHVMTDGDQLLSKSLSNSLMDAKLNIIFRERVPLSLLL